MKKRKREGKIQRISKQTGENMREKSIKRAIKNQKGGSNLKERRTARYDRKRAS